LRKKKRKRKLSVGGEGSLAGKGPASPPAGN
jgi:hypothetical protein